MEHVKCLILGSGPAGYTAAIYAARANLSPVVYEGLMPGGLLTTTTKIDNFPGYPEGVNGTMLMDDLRNQALRFGADIRSGFVTSVNLSKRPFVVTVDGLKEAVVDALIIATGACKVLRAGYWGRGVSVCSTCDGFFYWGEDVAVVGGGETAAEESTYQASICRKVYLVVRRYELRNLKVM